jgi:FkbM family methyltransferase
MLKAIKSKLKRKFRMIKGEIGYIKKDFDSEYEWYGNLYGGFNINPKKLTTNSIVYSFGIGEDISFDKAIIEKHGCSIFGFDPTPKSINWIKTQNLPEKFKFMEYGISTKNEMVDFYLPKNQNHVSGSLIDHKNVEVKNKVTVPMKCFKDITVELGHTQIDVLKMDIEGSEYDVIENILNSSVSINQIVIEFHDRFFEDGKIKTQNAVSLLKKFGYGVFAISESFEEISFININRL